MKATATGAWAGQDGNIAYCVDGGWRFYAPFVGLVAFVADEMASCWSTPATGWTDWAGVLDLQNVPLFGVNTSADSTNKFSVKSAAVLFDNTGGGVQFKINKHASTDTASLLYPDNYSGRAEIGLSGDDDFHFKVSPDGSAWTDAVVIDRSSGDVSLAGALGVSGAFVSPGISDSGSANAVEIDSSNRVGIGTGGTLSGARVLVQSDGTLTNMLVAQNGSNISFYCRDNLTTSSGENAANAPFKVRKDFDHVPLDQRRRYAQRLRR